MKQDYLKILEKLKGNKAGIFIDEANLFYSQKALGWRIDWQKVLEFFNQFYNIEIARYYMGLPIRKEGYEQSVAWEIRRSYHLFFEDIGEKVEHKR